ncbi:oxidoreductase [Pseudomonas sp. 10-1B]|uniref:NAD(P)/FAD-dependent oxidoreductase n=1 Tax=Pseudomonas sp. 10-1B TaxID=1546029 RepID=UPI00061FA28F|nr:FAD-binding oxidoreductase [Pseudomonas sp. 10-1B]KIY42257.1 oxidoreductase [Pseudomonas sp. 10-1B]
MDIRLKPHDDRTNGWSAILPPRQAHAPLDQRIKADWLVIGAGYAGLAAARRLAHNRPNEHIVVLEAGEAGDNASGRNSGFAIDVPHNVGSSTAELEKAANYKRLMKAGIAYLDDIVRARQIACDWSEKGKYHCAAAPQLAETLLRQHAHELDTLGEPYQWLEQAELARRLGTSFFHAGIYTPGCILLNPAALTRGLADTLPENVTLYENSAVTRLECGARIHASTAGGAVSASRLMLANNGSASQLAGFERQMFNVASYGSLTRPLTAEQRARIGNVEEWGVTPANAVSGATMRYTRDHRLLIRQQFDFTPRLQVDERVRQRVRAQHREVFLARFPALEDVALEHFWMGFFSITRNGAPRWGKIERNVYAAVGCNGVGIAKQTIAGVTLADLACGVDNELITDMRELGVPQRLPPRPFLDLGVKAYLAKERWVGRQEY